MNRILFNLSLLLLLILSGCSDSNTFSFSGESEHWSAELKVTQTKDDYENQNFTLQYKGKDLKSIGEITFKVDTNAGGFGGDKVSLDKNGILKYIDEANPSNAKVIEDAEVNVTVEWNNHTENIKLNNK